MSPSEASNAPDAMPPDSSVVLGPALRVRAAEHPDRTFIKFVGRESWSFAETLLRAERCAAGLRGLGVGPGHRVLVWLPNGPDIVAAWFGINLLGAVYVPINIAYRGSILGHVVANADAEVGIVHADLLCRLDEVEIGILRTVVVIGDNHATTRELELVSGFADDVTPIPPDELPAVKPWDLMSIIYTSGTTGASKGVLSSYMHLAQMSLGGREMVTADDCRLLSLPLFHAGGMLGVYGPLLRGGSVALVDSFSTTNFWATVRESGATVATLLGAMTAFLMKEPPSARDRDHTLRTVFLVPLPADAQAFAERFGVQLYTNYNSSETCNCLVSGPNPLKPGLCGRPRPGIEARLVDDNDIEVPQGQVGELILRSTRPWSIAHGYNKAPEATVQAWRNGWFHTGDLFFCDADGDFYFADRKKDALRRRGENISSFEVEAVILAHPQVREAAVVATPSEFGEDEVMAAISLRPGGKLEPAELIAFLQPRMAHFMIPRFLRFMPELPKTPTHKVQKHVLRAEGRTPDTWDREAAGIVVKRERIVNK